MPAPAKKKASAPPRRGQRPDGDATRQRLLETAGQVFAERGFADATSKEICERAGTPMASVNYHFGSRDALYEAVLIEAHRQFISVEELAQITQGPGAPERKIRALLGHLIALSARATAPWGFRVFLRELMSPSKAVPALVEKALRPKAGLILVLLAELLGLPPEHPAVQRSLAFAVLPCLVILLAPKEVQGRLLPAVNKGSEGLEDDLMRYLMAGLDAMARAHRPASTPAPPARREKSPGQGARRASRA